MAQARNKRERKARALLSPSAALSLLAEAGPACVVGLVGLAVSWTGAGGYWDGYDYARQMVSGELGGGLLLGRVGFVGLGHGLARGLEVLGVGTGATVSLLTAGISASALASAVALVGLARRLGIASPAWAAVFWMGSPVIASLSGALMGEMPAMLLVLAGCWAVVAGVQEQRPGAIAAGAATVVGSALFRETAAGWALAMPALVWFLTPAYERRRALQFTFLGLAAGGFAVVVAVGTLNPAVWSLLGSWVAGMSQSGDTWSEPVGEQVRLFLGYSAATAGVALPFAAWGLTRRLPKAAWVLVATGTALWLAHIFYPDLAYGPRFLAVALPAVALAAGHVPALLQARSLAVVAAAMAVAGALVASAVVTRHWRAAAEVSEALPARLAPLPPGILVAGWHCPALRFHVATHALAPGWEGLCPGWHWSPDAARGKVDRALTIGVPVYMLRGPTGWPSPRFADAERTVESWLSSELALESTEAPGVARIRAHSDRK